ncbi:BrnT family toxin [Magnetococcales bacterium HHB-1]
MDFTWDINKEYGNIRKHGISFTEAVTVFDDPNLITIDDLDHYEYRMVHTGISRQTRCLIVVTSFHTEANRIISARKATKRETQNYYRSLR